MSAAITRRRALAAGAAVVGASCVPGGAFAVAPAADLDAKLFRLLDRWQEIRNGCAAINDAFDVASDRAKAAYPPRPAALSFRGSDCLYDLGGTAHETERTPRGGTRFFYRHGDVEALRAAGPVTMWAVADDSEPTRRIPDQRGEARRLEIIAAHDRWSAERKVVDDAVGYTIAVEASESWCRDTNAAEDAVKLCPARTLAGLRRKAAWVADLLSTDAGDDDVAEVFLRQVAAFGGEAS